MKDFQTRYLDPRVVMVLITGGAAVLAHVPTLVHPNVALLSVAIMPLKVDIF